MKKLKLFMNEMDITPPINTTATNIPTNFIFFMCPPFLHPVPVTRDELFISSEEGYNSIEIYKQENKLVINAQSEAAFFDGVQFTVEIEGEIAQEDVEIIWMTIGGNTEYVEGNDRIIAEIKISDNDELICDTKINFAKKAIDAIEDVLERNGM